MKIALIMPLADQRGGAERLFVDLLRASREASDVEYRIAFLQDGPMVKAVRDFGYAVRVFPAGRLRDLSEYARTVAALAAWLDGEQVAAVLSWMAKAHLYAAPAALRAHIPAIWFQHDIPSKTWLERLVTCLPARAVFCCSETAQRAQQTLRPLRPTRVIYPAVDMDRFRPEAMQAPEEVRRELGLPCGVPLVGMVTRLQHWKGVHVFVEAAAQVRRACPGAQFYVIGGAHFSEPDYPEALRRQADALGVGAHVHFAGHQADIPAWMQAMDLLVHASVKPEPFGMVVLEGMALGKTVIATRAGGPLEVLADRPEQLVPPGDAQALAAAVLRFLDDEASRRAAGPVMRALAARYDTGRLAREVAVSLRETAGSGS